MITDSYEKNWKAFSETEYLTFIQNQSQSLATLARQKNKINKIIQTNKTLLLKIQQSANLISSLQDRVQQYESQIQNLMGCLKSERERVKELEHQLKCEKVFSSKKYDSLEKKYLETLEGYKRGWSQLEEKNQKLQLQVLGLRSTNEELSSQLQKTAQTTNNLAQLIEKQNQTLKEQDHECNELYLKNQQQEQILNKLYQQYNQLVTENEIKSVSIKQMSEKLEELTTRLSRKNSDWNLLMEIEKIRLGMRVLQKNEIDKIEHLIHD